MVGISVTDAAVELGISAVRVRQLIASGGLDAEQIAGRWIIDPGSLRRTAPQPGRPMSPRVAWAFLLDPDPEIQWLRPDEASRLRRRVDRIRTAPDPLALVRSWLSGRAGRSHSAVHDAPSLLSDDRIVPSGISDPRSGMSAAGYVEAYVHPDDLEDLAADHLMVTTPRSRANVVLHVSPVLPPRPVPDLVVIADLADADAPREEARARTMLDSWIADRSLTAES